MTTRMRELHPLSLDNGNVTATGAGVEVDITKYFVSPATREMMAVQSASTGGAATDTDGTLVTKLQESPTTVDSDFTDISGATFATVAQDVAAMEAIYFNTLATSKRIRAHRTVAGTVQNFEVATIAFLIKRSA